MKKFLATILSTIILFTNSVYAGSMFDLYEEYQYNPDFEYSGETIGHALKSTTAKIYYRRSCELTYQPVILDMSSLVSYISEYAKDNDIDTVMSYAFDHLTKHMRYGDKVALKSTISYVGSGVVLSSNGYIATNEHVISVSDDLRAESYISSCEENIQNDFNQFIKQVESVFGSQVITEDMKEQWLERFVDWYLARTKITSEDEPKITVCFPTADGKTDLDSAIEYPAEVIKNGKASIAQDDTLDVAILKIDADNLVALKLSDSYPETNSAITAAGFPGSASKLFRLNNSTEDTLAVTITDGVISRIVPIAGAKYQAIQVTAAVNHGNSGGPSVDNSLNIEGLNTFGNTEDNNLSYMVPAAALLDMTADLELNTAASTEQFLTGIQALQLGYGKRALDCFTELKAAQPNTPYIDNLIALANDAEQVVGPYAGLNYKKIGIVVGSLVVLIVIIVLIILLIKKAGKKNKGGNNGGANIDVGWTTDPINVLPGPKDTNTGLDFDDDILGK